MLGEPDVRSDAMSAARHDIVVFDQRFVVRLVQQAGLTFEVV